MNGCIIVAAGRGTRFKSKTPKTFYLLEGKPLLEYSLETFSNSTVIDGIILVVQKKFMKTKYISDLKQRFSKIKAIVPGGRFREESVANGLKYCPENWDIVLIHDGARPFVSASLIKRVVKGVLRNGICIPVYPVNGSVKVVKNNKVEHTIFEKNVGVAQTPQGFKRDIVEKIFFVNKKELKYFPDEASMCEKSGFFVYTTKGDVTNIKITTRQDLKIAKAILEIKR